MARRVTKPPADPRDARIADLERQVAALQSALADYTGVVNGRSALAKLRDQKGHFNLGPWGGKAPDGYRLLNGPRILSACDKAKVPFAQAVRYHHLGSGRFETELQGVIVPIEDSTRVAALADELERGNG